MPEAKSRYSRPALSTRTVPLPDVKTTSGRAYVWSTYCFSALITASGSTKDALERTIRDDKAERDGVPPECFKRDPGLAGHSAAGSARDVHETNAVVPISDVQFLIYRQVVNQRDVLPRETLHTLRSFRSFLRFRRPSRREEGTMRMFRTSMWCSWMAYDQRNSLVDPHIVYP